MLQAWLAGAVVGVLLLFAGNGGVSVAETRLPSGFAAVLAATVPLWVIVFARFVQGERVSVKSAAALAVGLARRDGPGRRRGRRPDTPSTWSSCSARRPPGDWDQC